MTEAAPFTAGGRRQQQTRGSAGHFFSDGIRTSGGGSDSCASRGWQRGAAEWYHNQQPPVKEQEAWRECRCVLVTLLYSFLLSSIGAALIALQTAIAEEPGMNEVRLQQDVPYQQLNSSMNALVGCHKDQNDLLGTVIIWLAFNANRLRSGSALGGAFVLYTWGCKFELGHLACVYVRSDRCWHGTVIDGGKPPKELDPSALLFGTALANNTCVTKKVLEVFNQGGKKTWEQQYANQLDHVTVVKRP